MRPEELLSLHLLPPVDEDGVPARPVAVEAVYDPRDALFVGRVVAVAEPEPLACFRSRGLCALRHWWAAETEGAPLLGVA